MSSDCSHWLVILFICSRLSVIHQTIRDTSDSDELDDFLPTDFMTTKCRTRSRLIGTILKENVEYVTAQLGSSVVLQCRFCYEESTTVPKMWYYSPRENGPNLNSEVEVELGMHDSEQKNHFYQRSDYSLVINNVTPSDTGYYYCHGTRGEDAEYKFNFMVDVINGTSRIVTGNREDWKTYKSNTYPNLKRRISGNRLHTRDCSGHKREFYFHAISEWTPWSNCDGCVGLRSKMAECKLVPTPAFYLRKKVENKAVAMTTSTSTTPTPPGNLSKLSYLLFEYGISCQSLDLGEARPDISMVAKHIGPFVLVEQCVAMCTHPRKSNQPKFKNTIALQEGDHITLVCPESTMSSEVEWRKDGVAVSKREATDDVDHIMVDTFSNLYITYARDVESGNYSCYISGDKIQEVTVSVNAESVQKHEAFLRHMHYLGFMLMFGVVFYVAGVIVAWTQRCSFKTIDFDEVDREEEKESQKHRRCNKIRDGEQTEEFELSRKLEEKFLHM